MTSIGLLVRLLSWVLTCLICLWDDLTYVVAKIVHAYYVVLACAMNKIIVEDNKSMIVFKSN